MRGQGGDVKQSKVYNIASILGVSHRYPYCREGPSQRNHFGKKSLRMKRLVTRKSSNYMQKVSLVNYSLTEKLIDAEIIL